MNQQKIVNLKIGDLLCVRLTDPEYLIAVPLEYTRSYAKEDVYNYNVCMLGPKADSLIFLYEVRFNKRLHEE